MGRSILELQSVDFVAVGIYILIVIGLSARSAQHLNDTSAFLMAGRRARAGVLTLFGFGAGTDCQQPLPLFPETWRSGFAGIWWQLIWLPVVPVLWVLAPLLRRTRALTIADLYGHRFSPGTAVLCAAYGMVVSTVFVATALYSSGRMINAATGNSLDRLASVADIRIPTVSLTWIATQAKDLHGEKAKPRLTFSMDWRALRGHEFAVAGLALIVAICGMSGGIGAAVTTSVLQSILVIGCTVVLLPMLFAEVGGWESVKAFNADRAVLLEEGSASAIFGSHYFPQPISVGYLCVLILTAIAGCIVQPHLMYVCGTGRKESSAQAGLTAGVLIRLLCTVAWLLFSMACVAWHSGTQPTPANVSEAKLATVSQSPENTVDGPTSPSADFPAINSAPATVEPALIAHGILKNLSPGLTGLLFVSLIAAACSASHVQMSAASGLFVENIYKRHFAPGHMENHYLSMTRVAGAMIMGSALLLQSVFSDGMQALLLLVKVPAALGISLWFGLFWRRWNAIAVWTSTTAGLVTWYLVSQCPGLLYEQIPLIRGLFVITESGVAMADVWQHGCYLAATIVVGFITSLLTPTPSCQQLDPFFELLRTPVVPGEVSIMPCVVPENNRQREAVIEWGEFQFPRPSLRGSLGFAAICIITAGLMFGLQMLAPLG